MSPNEHYFHDRASIHNRLDPWSDDETTARYESRHVYSLRQTQPRTRRAGAASAAPIVPDELTLPDILEEYDLEPTPYPKRRVTRGAAQPARRAAPEQRNSRAHSTQPWPAGSAWPAASAASSHGARLVVVPAQPHTAARTAPSASRQLQNRPPLWPVLSTRDDEEEEENPFARPSLSSSTWFRTTAAAAALFGAVLFGRVLLDASSVPNTQVSMPLGAAAPDATQAPATPSLEGPKAPEPPAAASVTPAPQPFAATSEHPNERPTSRARRPRTTREHTANTSRPQTEVRLRQPKARSHEPAPAIAEERESKPVRSAPAMLRINSRPWSQVFIDGKLFGNTPQLGIQLTAGKHSIRLVNSEFGMSKTFTLKLAAGESVTRVEMLSE
jgi:PEGA domain